MALGGMGSTPMTRRWFGNDVRCCCAMRARAFKGYNAIWSWRHGQPQIRTVGHYALASGQHTSAAFKPSNVRLIGKNGDLER
jgi:hypothetical protein